MDIAALLIDRGAHINAQDEWNFTPLHESAQKGRTQLCSLLISHGAQVTLKNQDNQTPLDLATAQDTKDLLEAIMPKKISLTVSNSMNRKLKTNKLIKNTNNSSNNNKTSKVSNYPNLVLSKKLSTQPSGVAVGLSSNMGVGSINPNSKKTLIPRIGVGSSQTHEHFIPKATPELTPLTLYPRRSLAVTPSSSVDNSSPSHVSNSNRMRCHSSSSRPISFIKSSNKNRNRRSSTNSSICEKSSEIFQYLTSIELEHLTNIFEKERITWDILCEMSHEQLIKIGVAAYGDRHKIIKEIAQRNLTHLPAKIESCDSSTTLLHLEKTHRDFISVANEMLGTINEHKYNLGGLFNTYELIKIERIVNETLWNKYLYQRRAISAVNHNHPYERMLFHGSPMIQAIIQNGFDERHSYIGGMFGAGLYFAEDSSKSNQYVYGIGGGDGCNDHHDKSCYICIRQIIFCRVTLGKPFYMTSACRMAHAPPGHHSVVGKPSMGGLIYPEYVVYRGEQAYPEFLIAYKILKS